MLSSLSVWVPSPLSSDSPFSNLAFSLSTAWTKHLPRFREQFLVPSFILTPSFHLLFLFQGLIPEELYVEKLLVNQVRSTKTPTNYRHEF